MTSDEIKVLYVGVIKCFQNGGKQGGYDVIHVLMGENMAKKLRKSGYILAQLNGQESRAIVSSSKRMAQDWDEDIEVDIIEAKTVARKVSRKCQCDIIQ